MKNGLSQLPNKYDLVKNTLVLILAGGRGSRLHELTDKRAKPALYFGGNRRIIDFALSNCMLHTLYYAIYKKGGLSCHKNGVNSLICSQHANKLMIPRGIVAQPMRYIKTWRLFEITTNQNIFSFLPATIFINKTIAKCC